MAKIRITHQSRFLCRAICPELASETILKEIAAARYARRKALNQQIKERVSINEPVNWIILWNCQKIFETDYQRYLIFLNCKNL